MSRIKFLVLFVFMLCMAAPAVHAQITPQDMERLKKMEDSLVVTVDSMYEALIPDTRLGYTERFVRQLVRTLRIPNSYHYGFDTLKKVINIIYAEDGAFRMFNWAIEPGNPVPKRYYAAIQLPTPELKLIGLNDYTDKLDQGLEDSVLTGGKWFGAIYYRIMPQVVGGKKIYTMFGLNNASLLTNRKVLDPMYFNDKGGVTFGAQIFGVGSRANPKVKVQRFVLEYKKSVAATMNWDPERQMIVYDKLESMSNDPSRRYTLVPSGQYDGLVWADDLWHVRHGIMQVQILQDGQAPDE
ncbi:hypothetical protein GCM10023093_00060 [Nemorincola caseinilytica]|uniref:Uncharacterized protein n=1 Tax=Nemorincola caseinilytica TaxID=2054315 RepID=A0ABP8N4W7_9BACT